MTTRAWVSGMVVALGAGLAAGAGVAVAASAQVPANKVPVMAVAGCLTEQGSDWVLTSASDPEPSIANGPPADQPYTGPKGGKNTVRLIGISEFDLPKHKGHTVLVKGLYIKAEPMSRLNVTSVTMIAESCPAK